MQKADMGLANVGMYRTVAHHAGSSSEDDYSDEEDSFLWKRKKMRYQAAMATNGGEQPFINPLLQRKKERQTSESDASDTCQSPVKEIHRECLVWKRVHLMHQTLLSAR